MAGLYKERNGIWYLSWYDDTGRKRCRSTRTRNWNFANQMKNQLEHEISLGKKISPENQSVRKIFDQYIDYLKFKTTERHWKTQRTLVNQFFKHQNIRTLRDIAATKIDRYLYARKHDKLRFIEYNHAPVTDATIRHDFNAIRAFLNWCVRRDFLINNPAKKIDIPKLPVKLPKFLDPATAKKLVEYAAGDQFEKDIPCKTVSIRYMILVVLFSGVRFEKELFRIRKKDVLISENTIRIHTSKSGSYKLVPYNPILNDYLQPLLDRLEPDDRLFPFKQFPRKQWKRLQEIMHIDITPYQLKHTFATMFYMQKKDLATLQSILGHSDITTTRRYAQTVDDYKRKQAESFTY